MRRLQGLLIAGLSALQIFAAQAPEFSGANALEHTRTMVAFGPRHAKSAAIAKTRQYILSQIKTSGGQIIDDSFIASTPIGPVAMQNIILKFTGTSGRSVVFTGHFDTKIIAGSTFTGANDGGSSAGALLELARVLAHQPRKDTVYIVWFDGEEAFGDWSATDSVYGSRHLAERWAAEGVLKSIRALINIDMTGDKDLQILWEANSSKELNNLIWSAAKSLGYGKHFSETSHAIEDDHIPFLRRGVPAADLIDFDYGPGHSYWHKSPDTMDKLSANSLEVTGRVLVEALKRLEQ